MPKLQVGDLGIQSTENSSFPRGICGKEGSCYTQHGIWSADPPERGCPGPRLWGGRRTFLLKPKTVSATYLHSQSGRPLFPQGAPASTLLLGPSPPPTKAAVQACLPLAWHGTAGLAEPLREARVRTRLDDLLGLS